MLLRLVFLLALLLPAPAVAQEARSALEGSWALELGGATIFRFRLIDFDAVEMTYVGTGLAPYVLQRVPATTALGPFREGATYSRSVRQEAEPEPKIPPEPEQAGDSQGPPDDVDDFRLPPSGARGR